MSFPQKINEQEYRESWKNWWRKQRGLRQERTCWAKSNRPHIRQTTLLEYCRLGKRVWGNKTDQRIMRDLHEWKVRLRTRNLQERNWQPKAGEWLYSVTRNGFVLQGKFDEDNIVHRNRVTLKVVFRTLGEAIKHKREAARRLRAIPLADWEAMGMHKWN